MHREPSTRAKVVTRRTYNRPTNSEGTRFETWEETIARVMNHQRWLWERALERPLDMFQRKELIDLADHIKDREVCVSGRTLWMGDTKRSKEREATQFNCAFKRAETVHDVVDLFWLLLNGSGTGFLPTTGHLCGFPKKLKIEQVFSTNDADYKGRPRNVETYDTKNKVWTIHIGDDAQAWAKTVGKLLAHPFPKAKTLVLNSSEIRGPGKRVEGYGWISVGDRPFQDALLNICKLLNDRAGHLLTSVDIVDVMNHLGTVLSTRRSAEIAILPFNHHEWQDFAKMKKDHWEHNPQRSQSNNSILFDAKPSRKQLEGIFDLITEAGGSEPGFINGEVARKRASWFSGTNPCGEILLSAAGSFCNLCEIDLSKFNGRWTQLKAAAYLIARANFRQTCTDLRDGVLSQSWHESNDHLRLMGVGITGFVSWEYQNDKHKMQELRKIVREAGRSMASELDMPLPKAVTTVKPSGTLSKIMDASEGCHKPLGKYILNNINFQASDPIVDKLRASNYNVFANPYDETGVLASFPIKWDDIDFEEVDGKLVNLESAVTQLDRYKFLMDNWTDHNTSITVSYSPDEIPSIIDWILEDKNWNSFVGVSFLLRADPTKTAQDLGYPYLPQQVITQEEFECYSEKLLPVDLDVDGMMVDDIDADCASGVCPTR